MLYCDNKITQFAILFMTVYIVLSVSASVINHNSTFCISTHWGRDKMAAIFAYAVFIRIFLNKNCVLIPISLKCVPNAWLYKTPALVQIIAWRRKGDKPLPEPMIMSLITDAYMHHFASMGKHRRKRAFHLRIIWSGEYRFQSIPYVYNNNNDDDNNNDNNNSDDDMMIICRMDMMTIMMIMVMMMIIIIRRRKKKKKKKNNNNDNDDNNNNDNNVTFIKR